MEWNQDIFYNNILQLIKDRCAGNATIFNEKIHSRDAATRWRAKKPTLNALNTITDVFGVSLNWLTTGREETKIKDLPSDSDIWRNKYYELLEKHQAVLEEIMEMKKPWSGKERRVAKLPPSHDAE